MRVTTGKAKGRKLKCVPGKNTRPPLDKVKKALFDILSDKVEDAYFLDLFAGTGSFGIEALSRGALRAFFVEKDKQVVKIIEDNLSRVGLKDQGVILHQDVFAAIRMLNEGEGKFDVIGIGPPYSKGLEQATLKELCTSGICSDGCVIFAQHHFKTKLEDTFEPFRMVHSKKYGDTCLTFFVSE